MSTRLTLLTMFVLGFATILIADEVPSKVVRSPAYDKMKTLVGSWEGSTKEGDKAFSATARFQLISDGSVIAAWLGEGTPHEMVTMFHMDGDNLMATHYCAAHNQPRLVLAAGGDADRLVFKFKDGTNLQSGAGHMQQVGFTFDGTDRHTEEWTYLQNGKEDTARFEFHRKS